MEVLQLILKVINEIYACFQTKREQGETEEQRRIRTMKERKAHESQKKMETVKQTTKKDGGFGFGKNDRE